MVGERSGGDVKYCPECGSEYRAGFDRCYDCDVELVDELPPEPEIDHAVPPLVEVFSASHVEADLVRAALVGHGIEAVMARPDQSSAYPMTVGSMGEGRVLVPEEQGQQALEIIGTLEEEEEVEPEVLAAPRNLGATWWIALIVAAAMLLLLLEGIRNIY
jgi:hypothetical protein